MGPRESEKGLLTFFERLNRGSSALSVPIPSYLHVLGYVATFMWQSCNSERSGSHINRLKTRERTGLLKDLCNSLGFGAFNNAPAHDIDTPRLVSKWRAEGHLTGTSFGSTEEDQSMLMKRHLESKSPRYLFNKEDALASYIRNNESAYVRLYS